MAEQYPIDKHVKNVITYLILAPMSACMIAKIFLKPILELDPNAPASDVFPQPLHQALIHLLQLIPEPFGNLFQAGQFFRLTDSLAQSLNPIKNLELYVINGFGSAGKVSLFVKRCLSVDTLNV